MGVTLRISCLCNRCDVNVNVVALSLSIFIYSGGLNTEDTGEDL